MQQTYENAIRDLQHKRTPKLPVKQQPIFQRRLPRTGQQAINDAATALASLWKMNRPSTT
jgi:hypothetical protein